MLLNDGPAHLAMANFLLHWHDPDWPLLNSAYQVNTSYTPNLTGDLLLLGLMKLLPALAAEQVLQGMCVLSIPVSGWLLLRTINRQAGGLALFLVPVAFQRMFYLGLYNYCLSVAGCLLSLWAYLRLVQAPSLARSVLLCIILVLTLVCQASGWIEAILAIGAMVCAASVIALAEGRRLGGVLVGSLPTIAAVLPGACLFLAFLLTLPGDANSSFGPSLLQRLVRLPFALPFKTIGLTMALCGMGLGSMLLLLFLRQVSVYRSSQTGSLEGLRQRALPIFCIPLVFLLYFFVVPDRAGGAWTHVARAEVFPYVGLLLAAAVFPETGRIRALSYAAGVVGCMAAIIPAFVLKTGQERTTLAEFMQADAFIGEHCTIAPVVFQTKLDAVNSASIFHNPLFQAASRFELHGDRVVLFSFLARLPLYPVRYRTGADPQDLIFHWKPSQSDTQVTMFDPLNYERQTAIPIDYILLWGMPEPAQQSLWDDIHDTRVNGFTRIYQSASGRLELFQRNQGGPPSACSTRL